METISSASNQHVKRLRQLATQHRLRRQSGLILLDGLHLIDALLASGGSVNELALSASGARRGEIAAWLAAHAELPHRVFSDSLFASFAATETPSGILALAARPQTAGAPPLAADCVLLDGVQDPGNVGTLLRTAAAAGIKSALLATGCADPWSAKSLRAGQGAQFALRIDENVDLAAFLGAFHGQGVVTRPDAALDLWQCQLVGPLAWVFGAEGQGVSAAVGAAARLSVRIPMPGNSESLNVAAAAAICLFERVRRQMADG